MCFLPPLDDKGSHLFHMVLLQGGGSIRPCPSKWPQSRVPQQFFNKHIVWATHIQEILRLLSQQSPAALSWPRQDTSFLTAQTYVSSPNGPANTKSSSYVETKNVCSFHFFFKVIISVYSYLKATLKKKTRTWSWLKEIGNLLSKIRNLLTYIN